MTWDIYGPLKERGEVKLKGYTVAELEFLLDVLQRSREVTIEHTEELRERVRREARKGSSLS